MKKLIPTVALALMGAAAVTGSTYAWFSMNKSVEATGMKVKATTAGALVIGTEVTGINKINVNFEDENATVLSHSTSTLGDMDTYPSGLKTITDDLDEVNPSTGFITDEEHANWRDATNGTLKYYVDYNVFIASAGEEMSGKTIVMSMTDAMKTEVQQNWARNNSTGTTGMFDTLFGFTVDVYSAGVFQATDDLAEAEFDYTGTYHLDNYKATLDLDVDSIPSSFDGDIAQGLLFKLRVYLDGDYAKHPTTMEECNDPSAIAGKAYFTNTSGVYTMLEGIVPGATLPSDKQIYQVADLGSASSDYKYVRTEKASTNDLNLGFHFEAADAN